MSSRDAYNTMLLQTRNVGILERKGFKIVETLENHDIRLTKKGADCIVDSDGNIRWTDEETHQKDKP